MRLANFLADLDPARFAPWPTFRSEARSDAAIVALACDQLVVHPGAVLGGSGAHELSPEEIGDVRQVIRKLAPLKGRSWSLMAAMVDPHLDVFRCTRLGRRRILLRRRIGRAAGQGQVEERRPGDDRRAFR